jgi:hypothetical protein
MHCIILLPDAAGRVPTAQELRQRGFVISAAVEMPEPALAMGNALAAEDSAHYGGPLSPEP